jgi:hypothetical protein
LILSNVIDAKPRERAQSRQHISDQDLIKQIEQLIKETHGPSVILTISPVVADWVLDHKNLFNRYKYTGKIGEYAGYMSEGNWKITGDTIKFSDIGYLRDGQNRLEACVKAGVAFTTHVVFGLDDAVFPWLDRTKTRSPGDALHIDGVNNGKEAAATVRWLEMFRTSSVKERISLLPAEALAAYKEHYDPAVLENSLKLARQVWKADGTPRSMAAALHYQFAHKNADLADEFFEAWATRNFSGRMRPLKKASEFLATLYTASNGRIHDVVRAAVWVIAWNLVVAKRIGTQPDFRWRPDAVFPKIKG